MPSEIELLLDKLEAEVDKSAALSSPLALAQYHDPNFLDPPHVRLLSDTIVAFSKGELLKPDGTPYTRLMVNMPPRHGKSQLITRTTPTWYLLNNPNKEVIVTGYGDNFAADFGLDCRRIIESHPELGVQLDPATSAKNNWDLLGYKGGMMTAGAGGTITGRGASLLVVDDPVKNSEDADSEVIREKHWGWWTGTVQSRLQDDKLVIMVMTRWHEDDLGGRVLLNEPGEWYQLSLPAIADHEEGLDAIGRSPGEALWPEKYSLEYLEGLKANMPSRWWNALYQQRPSVEGGNMFKAETFRYWSPKQTADGLVYVYTTPDGAAKEVHEDRIWRFTTLDLAATEKTSSDFTSAMVFGVTPDRELLLLDIIRVRMQSPDHVNLVRSIQMKFKIRFHGVEKATYGLTLIQICQRLGIPVLPLAPDKDKVARAWPAVGFIENGAIYFPRSHPLKAEFETELQQFPNAAHDDMVDTLSYGARVLADRVRRGGKPQVADPAPNQISVDRIIEHRKKKRKAGRYGDLW